MNFLGKGLGLSLLFPVVAMGDPAIPANRLFALVNRDHVATAIGQFDAKRGWMANTTFYQPLQPQDFLTLYGMSGKLGEVRIMDLRRPLPEDTFADWYPKISTWSSTSQSYALAVAGELPAIPSQVKALPLDTP